MCSINDKIDSQMYKDDITYFEHISKMYSIDDKIETIFSYFSFHLYENDMTYFEHMNRAFSISLKMGICSIKTMIHGIFPFVWTTSATDTVVELYKELCDKE